MPIIRILLEDGQLSIFQLSESTDQVDDLPSLSKLSGIAMNSQRAIKRSRLPLTDKVVLSDPEIRTTA